MTLWFFASRILAAALAVPVLLILTRFLGPEDFGRYNLVVVSATLSFGIFFGWIVTGIDRFHSAPEFGGRALAMALGTGALAILVPLVALMVSLPFLAESWRWPAVLVAAFTICHGLHEVATSGLRVLDRGKVFAISVVARPVLGLVLAVALLAMGYGYDAAALATAVGALLAGLYALRPLLQSAGTAWPDRQLMTTFFSFGFPLALVASGTMAQLLISQAALGWISGLEQLGYFAAAYALAMRAVSMPMSMLSRTMSALIFRSFETSGPKAAGDVLAHQFSYLMLISIPIVFALGVSARGVSELLFDDAFSAPVARLLPALAIGSFVLGLESALFSYPFMLARRTGLQFVLFLVTTAIHAAATLMGAYLLGDLGAAFAFLFSACCGSALVILVGRRLHPVRVPMAEVRPAVLSSLICLPIFFYANFVSGALSVLVTLAMGSLVFGVSLLMLKQRAALEVLEYLTKKWNAKLKV